ncbi:MAG: hypothetical protein D6736_17655 [Nitrospinota bacterium]|nr:MAG: hypothetical protein D6736_17655 [Nitrospinota bacterium]
MDKNEVHEAFEILLEELEVVANGLHDAGAAAFRAGDYTKARAAIEEATRLAEFREKVKALQKEWAGLFPASRTGRKSPHRRRTGRVLPRGLRTAEDAFRRPILEALVELGGRASIDEVLERVEHKMQGTLNKYDYQALPSDPRAIRWRNTAQWCRNTLVREGLMRSDSPYGIWEIAVPGRQWLAQQEDR